MNDRRKGDRRVPPALAQFALDKLTETGEQAAIDLTVQNVEILRARVAELDSVVLSLQCKVIERDSELAALKAQQRGGVVPGSVIPDRDGLVAAVCVLRSQGLGNLADSVSDALTALDGARLNQSGDGVNWKAVAGEQKSIIEGLQARLNPPGECVPDGWRMVKVGVEGVQFGNAWFSHEGITGYTAEQLNSGNCRVTGRAYMDWLDAPSAKKESER